MKNVRPSIDGYTDSRGEWRPENPISFAPVFTWPPKLIKFSIWLINYLFTWNLLYLGIVMLSYYYLQPPLETMKTFKISWMSTIFIRNMALVWIIYGGWHLYLYKFKKRGKDAKYCPRWQSTDGSTFLWNDQVYDNVFWACASAVPIWTAYEVISFWLYANGKLPYLDFHDHPWIFALTFLLIPLWRELHFYLIHRLIHWKPLYNSIHYLHHYNINPGPWSGLAMHPVEHILYFSVVLIHWIIPSHPLHFLFNSQHTALTPAPSHSGFEGKVGKIFTFGSYFHYLHHRLFDCNYGESTIPLDSWFGIFEDGSKTQHEKLESASAYNKLVVTKIIDESPSVKSFFLGSIDNRTLKQNLPGQHLSLKTPVSHNTLGDDARDKGDSHFKYAIRSYTISNNTEDNQYRISVKKESLGQVSSALHDTIKLGDILEANGPKGSFVLKKSNKKPRVFIAAGIGITPIISMLMSMEQSDNEIYLILLVKGEDQILFKQELQIIFENQSRIEVHVFISRKPIEQFDGGNKSWIIHNNRMDLSSLKAILPSKEHFDVYICGPGKMTSYLIEEIQIWKGKGTNIYTENFGNEIIRNNRIAGDKEIKIHFTKSNRSLAWDHHYNNILEFAESNGISMESGCMFGECGACSINIDKGSIEYNYQTAVKAEKGNILPCSCIPASDINIRA